MDEEKHKKAQEIIEKLNSEQVKHLWQDIEQNDSERAAQVRILARKNNQNNY